MSESRLLKLLTNIRWGILWGLFFAASLSCIASVQFLFKGASLEKKYGTTLSSIILTYFAVGIIAGCIGGLLRPAMKRQIGAIVSGVILGILGYGAIGVLLAGPPSHWSGANWGTAILLGVTVGGALGNSIWKDQRDLDLRTALLARKNHRK